MVVALASMAINVALWYRHMSSKLTGGSLSKGGKRRSLAMVRTDS